MLRAQRIGWITASLVALLEPFAFLTVSNFARSLRLIMMVGLVTDWVCLGLVFSLVACGGPSQHATGGLALGGFPVAGQKRTASASVHDELSRGVQQPDCDRAIEVLDASRLPTLTYSVVASTTVLCDHRALAYCRRQLVERACDLSGDAVIVDSPEAKPTSTGTLSRNEVMQSGQVIKFDK